MGGAIGGFREFLEHVVPGRVHLKEKQVELSEDRVIVYCFDSAGSQMSIFSQGRS